MQRERIAIHFLIAFLIAVVIYLVSFSWIEHLRTRKGGWEVTFQTDQYGAPALSVTERALRIRDVRFAFPGGRVEQTNFSRTIVFDRPITNVPFARIVYVDTTFLPGAIVIELFGNQIQLLPRVLMVNGREVPWQNGQRFELLPRKDPASQR